MKPALNESALRDRVASAHELTHARQQVASFQSEVAALRSEVAALRQALTSKHQDASSIAAADMIEANERIDALTGTPNRLLMLDRLEEAIGLARRRNSRLAVLFVDLDRFISINDSHGHAAGDEALQLAARRLQSAVRESDTVCRVSGDEFVVLLASLSLPTAARIAGKILSARSAKAPSMSAWQTGRA